MAHFVVVGAHHIDEMPLVILAEDIGGCYLVGWLGSAGTVPDSLDVVRRLPLVVP